VVSCFPQVGSHNEGEGQTRLEESSLGEYIISPELRKGNLPEPSTGTDSLSPTGPGQPPITTPFGLDSVHRVPAQALVGGHRGRPLLVHPLVFFFTPGVNPCRRILCRATFPRRYELPTQNTPGLGVPSGGWRPWAVRWRLWATGNQVKETFSLRATAFGPMSLAGAIRGPRATHQTENGR
jgi:hypothetical protein